MGSICTANREDRAGITGLQSFFFPLPCFTFREAALAEQIEDVVLVRWLYEQEEPSPHKLGIPGNRTEPCPATRYVGEMVSPACQKAALSAVFASLATANDAGPRMLVRMHD